MTLDVVYNPAQIEREAQKFWTDNKTFEVTEDPDKEKFYCLAMFPIPAENCIWDMYATIQSPM